MSMHILPQTCEHTKEFLARQMLGFKLFRQCLGPTTLASPALAQTSCRYKYLFI